ncbi:glutaminase [Paenibacillus swuensis]|uniref:Glutaminase n=2 Tax=Paenibacillus swuensis TaxID=1178515 RepID=A0A172TL21_9BACL|nr:glutaminase [Paenibacillus swuensis]
MNELDQIQDWLTEVVDISRVFASQGEVAAYIPELLKAPHDTLGICIISPDGQTISAGDVDFELTLQSISKVFTLILALMDLGEAHVFSKVGKEPTGDDFNSMLKLELVEPGIPFNPLINAGAIVISALIQGQSPQHKSERILNFFRLISGNATLEVDEEVFMSEAAHAHRNRSLAYFLKDNGVLTDQDDVEEILEIYFRHCSIKVTCSDMARMALVLANEGVDPASGESLIPRRYVQIAKTFMITCGMYNASGEFAIGVGLPAKSGVSGGILTLVPGKYGIGIVGPALNSKGNSVAGVHLIELLSRRQKWSMF